MMNRPKPTHALTSGSRSVHDTARVPLWALARLSTMRPNNQGSMNCAAASDRFAAARAQPRRASGPNRASTRIYRRRIFMVLVSPCQHFRRNLAECPPPATKGSSMRGELHSTVLGLERILVLPEALY